MDITLNNAPDLTMAEITKRLFNKNFLSDIQFCVGGQIIYAHSLELMKRSLVFQNQLQATLGDNKMILVDDYSYDSFYQFLRFIYTDECDMQEAYGMDLLKLALRYKVIRLESKIIEFLATCDSSMLLTLYEFSVANNYKLLYNQVKGEVAWYLNFCLEAEKFLTLPQVVVEEILRMDFIHKDVKEPEIFDGLVRWMNHYFEENQIETTERRTRFDKLIRLVRFPTMKFEEFRDCAAKHRDIFTDEDFKDIFKQIAFGPDLENSRWPSTPREEYKLHVECREFPSTERFETKLYVSRDVLLTGLRYGNEMSKADHNIFINALNRDTGATEVTKFKCAAQPTVFDTVISLGESIRLQTDFIYTIGFEFYVRNSQMDVLCRREAQDLLVNDELKVVKVMNSGANTIEIIFKAIEPEVCYNLGLAPEACNYLELEPESCNNVELEPQKLITI